MLRLVPRPQSEPGGQNPSTQTPRPLSTSVRFTKTTWKDNTRQSSINAQRCAAVAPPTAAVPRRRPRSTGGRAGGPCCCRSWRPLPKNRDGLAEAKGRRGGLAPTAGLPALARPRLSSSPPTPTWPLSRNDPLLETPTQKVTEVNSGHLANVKDNGEHSALAGSGRPTWKRSDVVEQHFGALKRQRDEIGPARQEEKLRPGPQGTAELRHRLTSTHRICRSASIFTLS